MCNGWPLGLWRQDAGTWEGHADSRWKVTCFCFTENSLYLGLGLRVFFGNPGLGEASMLESAQDGERGQERTRTTWAQTVPEAQCPFGVWCMATAGFLHLSLTGINQLQFSSVQSCLTLCDPMNCSMPALPVHHQLLEFTQTHFHQVSDAIQPSHPLSSPSPPAPNPSQHQSLFQ